MSADAAEPHDVIVVDCGRAYRHRDRRYLGNVRYFVDLVEADGKNTNLLKTPDMEKALSIAGRLGLPVLDRTGGIAA